MQEPLNPRRLTPIPTRPIFQLGCIDGFRCRECTTIRFRHRDCLVIRGGLVNLLFQATSFSPEGMVNQVGNDQKECMEPLKESGD
jgi:hypothetical protein